MPLSKLPAKRSVRSESVRRARFDLIAALKDAVITSELTHNEAQGQLSDLVCEIWESYKPLTWKLPGAVVFSTLRLSYLFASTKSWLSPVASQPDP